MLRQIVYTNNGYTGTVSQTANYSRSLEQDRKIHPQREAVKLCSEVGAPPTWSYTLLSE